MGTELTYLGTGEALGEDLYTVRWGDTVVPARVPAGQSFTVTTRLATAAAPPGPTAAARASASPITGGPRTAARSSGRGSARSCRRRCRPAGGSASSSRSIAPEQPGAYLLELDPVFENVSWFSKRNGGDTLRRPVEVTVDAR